MKPVGLLSLPVEVLHHVCKFLSVEDILACSATCHYLRYTFNDNIVWKKYLPDSFTSNLHTQELCLEPDFSLEDTLTPLCESRVTFMKKTNLVNNWKNVKFIASESTHTSPTYGFKNPLTVRQAIYMDRYIFLGRCIDPFKGDAIEVWDINKKPILLMDLKMNFLSDNHFYIVGDFLVVVECVQVKVYGIRISEKSLPYLFSFLITENNVIFHKPGNHHGTRNIRCHITMVDNYLFGNIGYYSCDFHIWDIVNAHKVGMFTSPVMGFLMSYQFHSGSCWFLRMKKGLGNSSYFFQFDIEKRSFSESILEVNRIVLHSVKYNSVFILFESSDCYPEGRRYIICSVYDIRNAEKLKERHLNNAKINNSGLESIEVINGQFVILCVDCFHLIDAMTLETLQQFPHEGFQEVMRHFNIHGSVFILAAKSHDTFKLWDLSKKEMTSRDICGFYMSNMYLNESCTKLACVSFYKMVVYHFL